MLHCFKLQRVFFCWSRSFSYFFTRIESCQMHTRCTFKLRSWILTNVLYTEIYTAAEFMFCIYFNVTAMCTNTKESKKYSQTGEQSNKHNEANCRFTFVLFSSVFFEWTESEIHWVKERRFHVNNNACKWKMIAGSSLWRNFIKLPTQKRIMLFRAHISLSLYVLCSARHKVETHCKKSSTD